MSARRPRVLCLTHRFPYPPNRGDRVRSYQVLRFLAERADVDLATLSDEPLPEPHLLKMKRLCRRVVAAPIGRRRWASAASQSLIGRSATEGLFASSTLRRVIRTWTAETEYDAAYVVCSGMASYLRVFQKPPRRTLVDLVDVDSQKWLDYAALSRRPLKWLFDLEGARLRHLERRLADTVDSVVLVSEAELNLFRTVSPDGRAVAIVNGVDLQYFSPSEVKEDEYSVVFVGALDYRANVLGARWFAEHVWPQLRARVPAATLSLVGRNPVPQIQELERIPGVSVHGDVPDVRPHLTRSAIAIAPLQVARGIQNKVLEAMAMGKSVVASPQALEGIAAMDGTHVCVAASPDEWADRIVNLWQAPDVRRAMGQRARRLVEDQHCWDACLAPLEGLLDLPPPQNRFAVKAASSMPAR